MAMIFWLRLRPKSSRPQSRYPFTTLSSISEGLIHFCSLPSPSALLDSSWWGRSLLLLRSSSRIRLSRISCYSSGLPYLTWSQPWDSSRESSSFLSRSSRMKRSLERGSALSAGFSSELGWEALRLEGWNSFSIHSLLQLDCSMKSSRSELGSNCLRSFMRTFSFLLRLFHCSACSPWLPLPRRSLLRVISPVTSSLYLARLSFSLSLSSSDWLFSSIHLSWQLLDFSCSALLRRLLEIEECCDWLRGVAESTSLADESGWNRSEMMDSAAKALISWEGSLTSLSVACWKSSRYLLTTMCFRARFHARWITSTFRVSSSRESCLLLMMALTTSSCELVLLVKTGTSSLMVLRMRTSMLLRYSLKVLECDSTQRRSLVIGLLPPSSEASRLMLSSFDTTLSFLPKEACDCARRFLTPELSDSSSAGLLALIRMNEFTWPFFRDLVVVLVLPMRLAETPALCCAGWVLLECGLGFLRVACASGCSAEGPSVLTLRSLKRSGVKVFLPTTLLGFFLCRLLSWERRCSADFLSSSLSLPLSLISISQGAEEKAGFCILAMRLAGSGFCLFWPRLQEILILIFCCGLNIALLLLSLAI